MNAAGIMLSEQLVALTIINALPKSYQLLSSTILATIDLTTVKTQLSGLNCPTSKAWVV